MIPAKELKNVHKEYKMCDLHILMQDVKYNNNEV